MPSERWERIQDGLWSALQRTPAAREAFLAETWAADPELLAEIRSLLEAHQQSGGFLGPGEEHHPRRELEALLQAYEQQEDGPAILPVPDPPSSPDPLLDRTISHYHISRKLGEGGMGVVYEARDIRLDRVVALKFLPPHLDGDEEAKGRLIREARAASALDHVNICTIHEIAETDTGQVFIAMACYSGETLQTKMERRALPPEGALGYAMGVAQGLAKAHEQGLVHRDVKPANVMVTVDGVVKLLDFGLARAADGRPTTPGSARATVAYMSPEQARGEIVDHRTDIWSLGVMLYEMLAYQRPFRGDQPQGIVHAILNEEPDLALALRPEIPAVVDRILRKALAKGPAERYEGIQELVEDLQLARLMSAGAGTGVSAAVRSGPASRPGRGQLLPEGERLQATVVVSILGGLIDLIEQSAPESVDHVVRLIRDHVTGVVQEHGGFIDRFAGEQITAIFGVPAPQEDDCVQASRAALELHLWLRNQARTGSLPEMEVRSGIDTGLVVARQPGQAQESCRIEGSPLQVAARLARHAGTDEVLVSPESRRLLLALFETEEGAPLSEKAPAEGMRTARIVEESVPRSRVDAADPAWLTTYAGRDEELETLHRSFRRAVAGEGQLVTVMGEAGLGKSRLLYEFRRGLQHDGVAILQGRCSSGRDLIPFQPFSEVLRDHFLTGRRTPGSDGADRVVAGVLEVTSELDVYIPLYLHLLSLAGEAHPLPKDLKGEHLHLALLEALVAIFTLSARQAPLALFLEDWHWSDEASRKVLDRLVELLPAYPLLVVVTFRPEYASGWAHPAHQTTIRLRPLEEGPATTIMTSALRADHVPEAVSALLHERTGGNPFFLEEICHALREEGTLTVEEGRVIPVRSMHTLKLPNTVQAVIRTRLHRLDREARRVLRLASVAGRVFTRDLLQRALGREGGSTASLDATLEVLRDAGLVRQTEVLPEATYRFQHALTQEVAYDSLLPHQRKRMHGHMAQAIEEGFRDSLEEHAEVLAHHFGEVKRWRKVVHYSRLAAERACRLGQLTETLALYERARNGLECLPQGPERRQTLIELLLRQERLNEQIGDHEAQQDTIDELFALLGSVDDPETLAETHIRQGDLHILQGRFQQAEEALNEALRVSRARTHVPGEQKALRSIGFLRWHQDRHQEAVSINEELVVLDRQGGDAEALMTDLLNLLTVLRRMKAFDRGLICVEELLVLSEQVEDPLRRLPLYNNIGEFYRGAGDHVRALFYIDRAMEISERHRIRPSQTYQLVMRAQIFLEQGRVEESIQCYQDAIDLHRSDRPSIGVHGSKPVNRRLGSALGLASLLRSLGEMLVALQRGEEALPYLQEAASLFGRSQDPETEALLRCRVAVLHEGGERAADAQVSWEQVRSLCQGLGDVVGECQALQGLGRMARRQGETRDALLWYRAALQLAEQAGDEAKQGELHNTVGILVWHRGAYPEALAHYEQALRIYEAREEPIHAGLMLNSIGATLHEMGRSEDAVRALKRAIHLHRRTEQRQLEAYALGVLGDAYFGMDRHTEALPCYEASLRLRPDLGDRRGEGWMLHRLARIHAAQGRAESSRSAALQATVIAAELGDLELSRTCRPLTALPGA